MKLVLFSTTDRSLSEAKDVVKMFDEGLTSFHLKKSSFESHEMDEYLNNIPSKYHKYIVLHSNHHLRKKYRIGGLHISRTHRRRKYNSWWKMFRLRQFSRKIYFTRTFSKLSSISESKKKFEYVFLSPIYDSISKIGHSGNFGNRSLKKFVQLSKSPVIALGGVEPDKFEECKELGFDGVAILGFVWNHETLSPLEAFRIARDKAESLD